VSWWHKYRYKNLTILALSLIAAFFLSAYQPFHQFLFNLGSFGYVGAFLAGALFVSTFTVATGAVILLFLAEKLSPLEIGLIAGLGAVLGDYLIFRFIKNNLIEEISLVYHLIGGDYLTTVLRSRYFSWTLPVIGAIIIATPLPDEVGITLMGISKLKTYQFLLLSFVLNAAGIFLVVSAAVIFKT